MLLEATDLCDNLAKFRLPLGAAFGVALAAFSLLGLAAPAQAADEPDLIFRRSTVFKLLSPNDKLATYGLDDPEVDGVACHFTVPEKGGFKGWLGLVDGNLSVLHS
jgi:CreA protein